MNDSPSSPQPADSERLKLVVDTWKHCVGVQMHFNDISMKIRTLYFTVLAAAMGLIGVVQDKRINVPTPPIAIDLALFVVAFLIPLSMLFYFLDRFWYHRLLLGAVGHCADIEKRYGQELPELKLGAKISSESAVAVPPFWGWFFRHVLHIRDQRFLVGSMLHSDAKIEVLYKSVYRPLYLVVLIYALFGGVAFKGQSLVALLLSSVPIPS